MMGTFMKRTVSLIIVVVIALAALLYFFRIDIYRTTVANVEIAPIGPMIINGRRYNTTVQNIHIHEDEGGIAFIYLAKRRSTFWYQSHYCYIARISVIESDETHCAVEFTDSSDYSIGDAVIVAIDKDLSHGKDVYVSTYVSSSPD